MTLKLLFLHMCSVYLKCLDFLTPVISVYTMYKYVRMVCIQFCIQTKILYVYGLYTACFSACLLLIQATTNELKSQITTLQAALEEAGEEIAAMKEHEAKQTTQFQVCLRC